MRRRRWQVVMTMVDIDRDRSMPVSSHWTHKAALRAAVFWMHSGREVGLSPQHWAIRRTPHPDEE